VTVLRNDGHTSQAIAQQLNREGFHPPRRDERFNSGLIRALLIKFGLTKPREDSEHGVLRE
jgi:hypothetical protein